MTIVVVIDTMQGTAEQSSNAFRSPATERGRVSQAETQSLLMHSGDDQSRDPVLSWQTVIVTASSLAVLMLVAVVAACKLRHSGVATKSNK